MFMDLYKEMMKMFIDLYKKIKIRSPKKVGSLGVQVGFRNMGLGVWMLVLGFWEIGFGACVLAFGVDLAVLMVLGFGMLRLRLLGFMVWVYLHVGFSNAQFAAKAMKTKPRVNVNSVLPCIRAKTPSNGL